MMTTLLHSLKEGQHSEHTKTCHLHGWVVGELSPPDNDKHWHSSCSDVELLRLFAKQSLLPLVNPSATKSEHSTDLSQADHTLCHPWHRKFLSDGHPITNLLMLKIHTNSSNRSSFPLINQSSSTAYKGTKHQQWQHSVPAHHVHTLKQPLLS